MIFTAIGVDPGVHLVAVSIVQQLGNKKVPLRPLSQDLILIDESPYPWSRLLLQSTMSRALQETYNCLKKCLIESPQIVDYTTTSVVEGQQSYRTGERRSFDPSDLIRLAQVAGACAQALYHPAIPVLIPTPAQWKGQVPKKIHHARLLAKLPNSAAFEASLKERYGANREHVLDATGLALWGILQMQQKYRTAAAPPS